MEALQPNKQIVGEATGENTRAGRPLFRTPEGELVSEKSVTIPIGGKYYNVPSIHGGKEYDEETLSRAIIKGRIIPTSVHNTEDEAIEAAIERSNNLIKNPYVSEKDLQEYQSLGKQMEGITARDVGRTIAEFTPVIGDALLAKDAAQSFSEGDIKGGLIDTAALGIGMIPVVGDIAAKGIKKLKEIRKADVARAEKLIDDSKELENWQKENKLPETQRQTNPELSRQAALDLREGNITSKEARKIIKEAIPDTKLYTAKTMPNMPTVTEIVGSIGKKAKKYGILGVKGFNLKNGQKISSRLDINAYDNYDTWVVSIHDGTKDAGSVLGYGQAIRLTGGIKFKSNVGLDAVDIARGRRFVKETGKDAVDKKTGEIAKQNKSTIARIFGEYADEDPYELQEKARKILADADPEWTQVGMNPYRGSAFYDKATGKPVFDAEEVIQVGPLVLAKNVKTPTISDMKQMSMRTRDGKIRIFNKGGAVMQDQMEKAFMDEGGLKDEGGETDPQSGNEVPSGSLKKEVRDDMPTMLSEGEFVFPADVVRYIGLEKLMKLRQDAKQGLKMMEAMGQMGNSEEATIPDDLPFGMADLVVITGGKDEPKEMAEGGVLTGQQGLFADPRFAGQGVTPTPTYTPAEIENIRKGLRTQFDEIQEDIKPPKEEEPEDPVVAPEVQEVQAPEPESRFDRRRSETRGFNEYVKEQQRMGGDFSTVKSYEDRDAVDWLKAATDINGLMGDVVTKLPIVGDLVNLSYKGARDYITNLRTSGEFNKLDEDTKFALEIFEKSKKPKGILSVLKDVFQGKTLKEAFTPEEYEELTEEELARIKAIRDKAIAAAKKRREEYSNLSATDRTQRRQFKVTGIFNDGQGNIIQMKGDQVLYQVDGRNTYVNIADIAEAGDDPSLLMERILASRYKGYDASGKPIATRDEAEVDAAMPQYVQEYEAEVTSASNAVATNDSSDSDGNQAFNIDDLVNLKDIEAKLEQDKQVQESLVDDNIGGTPVSELVGKGPSGVDIANIYESATAPEVKDITEEEEVDLPSEDTSEDALDFDLNYDDFTNLEKTVELDDPADTSYLQSGSPEQVGGLSSEMDDKGFAQLENLVPAEAAEVTPIEAGEEKKLTKDDLDGTFGTWFKYKTQNIMGGLDNIFSRPDDSDVELDVFGNKMTDAQRTVNNIIARTKDNKRKAEIQAAVDKAKTPTEKKDAAIDALLKTGDGGQGSSQKTVDIVKDIRKRQKKEADAPFKDGVFIPKYVAPTAPKIDYDAGKTPSAPSVGPFAKGGLAKQKVKKPAKKRKGGLASKKK